MTEHFDAKEFQTHPMFSKELEREGEVLRAGVISSAE
jgi:hypothetical protein